MIILRQLVIFHDSKITVQNDKHEYKQVEDNFINVSTS